MAQVIEIGSFADPRLDIYARLTENQLRSGHGLEDRLFIAESPNVILRALDAGYEPESMLMDRRHAEGAAADVIKAAAEAYGRSQGAAFPVYTGNPALLRGITGFELTRGVLCAMRRRPLPGLGEVLSGARRIAVLEQVENPTNVGAIFRSAAALGMDAVLLTPGCSDPLYRRAARVSMGTVFQVPWTKIPGTPEEWETSGTGILHEYGFAVAALALKEDALPVYDPVLKAVPKLALLLGTEGDGLAQTTIASADYSVVIPMAHGVDSLNVAAASAVIFWELGKRI